MAALDYPQLAYGGRLGGVADAVLLLRRVHLQELHEVPEDDEPLRPLAGQQVVQEAPERSVVEEVLRGVEGPGARVVPDREVQVTDHHDIVPVVLRHMNRPSLAA